MDNAVLCIHCFESLHCKVTALPVVGLQATETSTTFETRYALTLACCFWLQFQLDRMSLADSDRNFRFNRLSLTRSSGHSSPTTRSRTSSQRRLSFQSSSVQSATAAAPVRGLAQLLAMCFAIPGVHLAREVDIPEQEDATIVQMVANVDSFYQYAGGSYAPLQQVLPMIDQMPAKTLSSSKLRVSTSFNTCSDPGSMSVESGSPARYYTRVISL